jgi:hydrogenase expression/formation protein HypC
MRVASVAGERATVALGETQIDCSVELLDDVSAGDYVIVHAGFAIQKLGVAEAEETIRLLDQMVAGAGGDPAAAGEASPPGAGRRP